MKKSQTEMIGLVILVVLIVIGMLFYVKFALIPSKAEKDTSLELQKAIFIAGAISKVYICENISLQEAIVNCDFKGEICGEDSCGVIKKEVPRIISLALGGEYEIGKNITGEKTFSFYAMQRDRKVIEIGSCPGKAGIVGSYAFKGEGKDYIANYKLC